MREFSAACDQFQQEYGRYPGVIPESVLSSYEPNASPISSTENAILELLGGFRVMRPDDDGTSAETEYNAYVANGALVFSFGSSGWRLAVNPNRIGEGPIIDGKANGPFFTPNASSFMVAKGQILSTGLNASDLDIIPDLIDAWGQPIIYMRQLRTSVGVMG